MSTLDELNRRLDALEYVLPALVTENPEPGDFWSAFAGEADLIEDQAGDHAGHVFRRLQAMLVPHGYAIGELPMDE